MPYYNPHNITYAKPVVKLMFMGSNIDYPVNYSQLTIGSNIVFDLINGLVSIGSNIPTSIANMLFGVSSLANSTLGVMNFSTGSLDNNSIARMSFIINAEEPPVQDIILFEDNFTGTGSAYGRYADTTNAFSPDLSWWESMSQTYVEDGYLRNTGDPYGGNTYEVSLNVGSYGLTAEYISGGNTLTTEINASAHEIHIGVTRITMDHHECIVQWIDHDTGAVIGSEAITVDQNIGVLVNAVVNVPPMSGTGRYYVLFGLGTGIDYFKIANPV